MYSFILLLAASAATSSRPPDLDLHWLDPVLTEALEHNLDSYMTDSKLCGLLGSPKPCHVQLHPNSSCTAVSAGVLSLDDVGPQLLQLTLKGLTASCAFLLTIVNASVSAIPLDGVSVTKLNIHFSSIDWRLQLTTTSGVPTAATYQVCALSIGTVLPLCMRFWVPVGVPESARSPTVNKLFQESGALSGVRPPVSHLHSLHYHLLLPVQPLRYQHH